MDAWERMLRDEREALDFLLGEEFGMTADLQREIERVLAELRDIRFAHLVIKPVLTMPAKVK